MQVEVSGDASQPLFQTLSSTKRGIITVEELSETSFRVQFENDPNAGKRMQGITAY